MERQQGGGLHPPSRKQQQRSAGDNSEQVVQELVVILNHPAGSCEPTSPGSPTAREAVPHPLVFCNSLFSIRRVWLLAFIEEIGEVSEKGSFGCVSSFCYFPYCTLITRGTGAV